MESSDAVTVELTVSTTVDSAAASLVAVSSVAVSLAVVSLAVVSSLAALALETVVGDDFGEESPVTVVAAF
ncbi:unnamed protein product [[Candida] boidinii]|uniref:Unnamed protein product n=1 Tax=Candida boidinii TaxID=5477 RepID=A0ACB5U8U8_CANBO|nr:unnamed protein product [[Candida] boidinii]